ncbi:MAG: hypothetical protein ACLRZ9_05955 [Eubacterium sp.]
MLSEKEQTEFREKLSLMNIVFSDIPKVGYYNQNNPDKDLLNAEYNGKIMDLKAFNEILVVGNSIINVTSNSVEKDLEIVLCVAHSLHFDGFLGYLS